MTPPASSFHTKASSSVFGTAGSSCHLRRGEEDRPFAKSREQLIRRLLKPKHLACPFRPITSGSTFLTPWMAALGGFALARSAGRSSFGPLTAWRGGRRLGRAVSVPFAVRCSSAAKEASTDQESKVRALLPQVLACAGSFPLFRARV